MDILSKKDKMILEELQKDCRQSMRKLSRKLGIPATTIHERIRKMIKKGVIKKFSAILDLEKIGLPTTAIVLVKRSGTEKKGKIDYKHIGKVLSKFPEIQEVYVVTGEYDAILKIRGKSEKEIGAYVVDKLWNISDVERSITCFVLHASKEENELKLV